MKLMDVKPCPPKCEFDWADFHRKFDIALAHYIDEQGAMPTQERLLDFMEYSYAKKVKSEKEGTK